MLPGLPRVRRARDRGRRPQRRVRRQRAGLRRRGPRHDRTGGHRRGRRHVRCSSTSGPGTFGDTLEETLRAATASPSATGRSRSPLSTVGGWVACRCAGQYSTRYGKIEDMVVGLEVALADGRVIRTGGQAPRAACGPDLTQLFVGSEGTLGRHHRGPAAGPPAPGRERRSAYRFAAFADGPRRLPADAAAGCHAGGAAPLRRGRVRPVVRGGRRRLLIVLDEGDPAADRRHAGGRRRGGRTGRPCSDDALVDRWLEHRNAPAALESLVRARDRGRHHRGGGPWSALPAIYREAIDAL